jgi:hypothetical protein
MLLLPAMSSGRCRRYHRIIIAGIVGIDENPRQGFIKLFTGVNNTAD